MMSIAVVHLLAACVLGGGKSADQSAATPSGPMIETVSAADIPAVCITDNAVTVLEEFVRRYNAEDVDGALALVQPDYLSMDVLDTESGEEPLRRFAVEFAGDTGFHTLTHDRLQAYLEERFQQDERLRLTRAIIAPSADLNGEREWSERVVDIAVELERWSAEEAVHHVRGKGVVVDCESGRILSWVVERGSLS